MPQITGIYRGAFVNADLLADATSAAMITDQFLELGKYTVLAGQAVMLGFGNLTGQQNALGRMYITLKNGATQLEGTIRLQWYDAGGRPKDVLGEWRTEETRGSATDPSLQVPLPAMNPALTKDKSLRLLFKGDAVTAVVKADSTVRVSYTNIALA